MHQPLADGAVDGFAEIAALRVFEMGAAGEQRHLHVRERRAEQYALVLLLKDVRADQVLPALFEHVQRAAALKGDPASARAGREQEVHLGVVAQRLKVAAGVHRVLDGLAVEHLAVPERDGKAEPCFHQLPQDFQLHLAHHMHAQLPQRFVPLHGERGFLVLQRAEGGEHGAQVIRLVPLGAGEQDRRELARPGGRLIPHAVPGAHGGKARGTAQLPGTGRLDRRETAAPAAQKLRHLLARLRPVRRAAEHLVAAAQRPGGDLQPDQAACPAPHLVRHRAKGCVLLFLPVRFRQKLHAVQKFPHSLAPQGGAGKAWEQPALPHQPPQFRKPFVRRSGSIQITREQIVVKRGQLLRERVVYFPGKAVEQDGGGAAFAAQLCECAGRVRAGTVDLVEEQQYRHVIVREKPPERFRVALHALGAAHDEDGVIERRKHALHLGGKIGVAGRVEKIINGVAPAKIRLSGKDGDSPLALDRLRVEEGVPVVDAPALPQSAAEVEKLLGERCFPRVDVGQDADTDFSFRLPFFFFRHRKSSISNKTYCQYIMGVSPRRDMFLDDMIFLFLRPINSLTEEFSRDILRVD